MTDRPKQKRSLSDNQRIAWLRLIRSENVGPQTFRELVNHYGGAESALEALPGLSQKGGRSKPVRIYSKREAQTEWTAAKKIGAELVAMGESGYPHRLTWLEVPPPLLYIQGNKDIIERPIISIVGSRNASAIGQKFTRILANELGARDFVIASGLARGIDTAAHQAALERGTIAVVAGGIDVIYPRENEALHMEIGVTGLLISERPPGLKPRSTDFPRRNRLISGVSVGVIVVEAARRSGSLITARFAGEQGREVFAVPGNPLDPRATGTNHLIREGATLITSAEDVLTALAPILGEDWTDGEVMKEGFEVEPPIWDDRAAPEQIPSIGISERQRVIQALGPVPTEIDELIRATGLSAREVHIILLELDLAGRLERHRLQSVSLIS